MAQALASLGRVGKAAAEYHAALKINPDDVAACGNLAWIRATCPDPRYRDGVEAVPLAQRTVQLAPDDPACLDTLAAAYAETGRFADAAATADQAMKLAARQGNAALAASLRQRLALYQAGKPFREP